MNKETARPLKRLYDRIVAIEECYADIIIEGKSLQRELVEMLEIIHPQHPQHPPAAICHACALIARAEKTL